VEQERLQFPDPDRKLRSDDALDALEHKRWIQRMQTDVDRSTLLTAVLPRPPATEIAHAGRGTRRTALAPAGLPQLIC
jgi:hypothetical protein